MFLTLDEIGTQPADHRLYVLEPSIDGRVVLIESEQLPGESPIIFQKTEVFDNPVRDNFDFDKLKRFGQVVESTEANRFYGCFDRSIAGHHDDVAVRVYGTGSLEHFQTVWTWRHHQIGKDDVELLAGVEKSESVGAAFCGSQTESTGLHVLAECQSKVTVVVNDEQPGFSWGEIRNLDHDGLIAKSVENFSV